MGKGSWPACLSVLWPSFNKCLVGALTPPGSVLDAKCPKLCELLPPGGSHSREGIAMATEPPRAEWGGSWGGLDRAPETPSLVLAAGKFAKNLDFWALLPG